MTLTDQRPAPPTRRLPDWFKVPAPGSERYRALKALVQGSALHTVCEEARCPNIGECWDRGTATFMILGDTCTRACRYCAVKAGDPGGVVDTMEPLRVAQAIRRMGITYAVITSVDRDDLPDGGASIFAQTIRAVRRVADGVGVEVLIPDFGGHRDALSAVIEAAPTVLNHNIESVPRVFRAVRPRGNYWQSLEVLDRAKRAGMRTKSGVMVGLGETWPELLSTMDDLVSVGCDILTIGQYLRPTPSHAPLDRFYTPAEFNSLRDEGLARGFAHVESGPLVRSSYHADEQAGS